MEYESGVLIPLDDVEVLLELMSVGVEEFGKLLDDTVARFDQSVRVHERWLTEALETLRRYTSDWQGLTDEDVPRVRELCETVGVEFDRKDTYPDVVEALDSFVSDIEYTKDDLNILADRVREGASTIENGVTVDELFDILYDLDPENHVSIPRYEYDRAVERAESQ